MTNREVIREAENFCETHNINDYPVGIVALCKKLGLSVFEEYMNPDVSGIIVVDNKEWEKYGTNQFIVVNLVELPTRRRFTVAHELAHYILHKNNSVLYAHRDLRQDSPDQKRIETEANLFATNILMPEKLIRDKVEDIKSQGFGNVPAFVLRKEIADSFLVSESAAEVRLKQLGII